VLTALLTSFCAFSVLLALHGAHSHIVEHIDRKSEHLERVARMSQQDAVNAVVAELGKAKGEIVAKISDLQAQIDAGTPAAELDLSGLVAAAQALDDIVPDPAPVDPAPVDPPVDPSV
jgi:hypothetical protein